MAGSDNGPGLPVGGLIAAIVLAAGAIVITQIPYVVSRPPVPELQRPPVGTVQDVDARLWEDPFGAVARHREKATRPGGQKLPEHRPQALAKMIHASGGQRPTVVIGVLVPGGPYSEDTEIRQRTRYALVSALSRLGLRADNAERIGYFQTPPDARGATAAVPFEWFARVSSEDVYLTSARRALVLWLDASTSFERLAGLRALFDDLGLCASKRLPHDVQRIVIGPAGSEGLEAMVAEAGDAPRARRLRGCLEGTQMYSPFATGRFDDGRGEASQLAAAGVRFIRTTATDDALMPALARELRLRGFDPASPRHLVAVVSELDTAYGRRLVSTVRRGLCEGQTNCGERVYRYHYLRGLDGAVPRRPDAKDAAPADRASGAKPEAPAAEDIERPAGQSQFDYLRRLATRMLAIEKYGDGRRFRAIGVLGSDVYDKMLILQALRRDFPGAVFFTTDLDARLLHPREVRWTRNLVVVSSFGLTLREQAQHDAPPFRSGYQTATYLSALAGVIGAAPGQHGAVPESRIHEWLRTPRVFEIGRTEAVDLTPRVVTSEAFAWERCRDIVTCLQIQPDRAAYVRMPWVATGWLAAAIALAVALAALASSRVRRHMTAAVTTLVAHPVPAVGGATAVALASGIVVLAHELDPEIVEPFRLLEGVSLWPTEAIRLLAGVTAVAMIVYVQRSERRRKEKLSEFFPGFEPQADGPRWRDLLRPRALRRIFLTKASDDELRRDVYVEDEWTYHCYQASPPAHWARVVVAGALFSGIAGCMVFAFGFPHVPYRGPVSRVVDIAVLVVSVGPLVALLFVVADVIKLCDKFAHRLAAPTPNRWPSVTCDKFGVPFDTPLTAVIDVRFMAAWTARIAPFIYFPFVVLFLMVVARSSLFDGWDVPWSLVAVFGISLACATALVVILRHAAERLRRFALARLSGRLASIEHDAAHDEVRRRIERLIAEVRDTKTGAFAPLMHQPVVRAVLLPVSGAGGVAMLEYLLLR